MTDYKQVLLSNSEYQTVGAINAGLLGRDAGYGVSCDGAARYQLIKQVGMLVMGPIVRDQVSVEPLYSVGLY
jgi:hypothetical protein